MPSSCIERRSRTRFDALPLVLMAALNLPIGIVLGLAGEKLTRPQKLRQR